MYNVTQEIKDLFNSKGSIKRGYLSIVPLSNEESEIIDESKIKSFEILDDIYTPKSGIIGSVIAKQLTINFYQNTSILDREIDVYIGVENTEGIPTYLPYGRYIVQRPETNELTESCSAEALDYMVKFNLPFEDTLTYPCTLKDLLKAICEQCGVELGTFNFINEGFSIENNQFVNGESCREVLMAIAQLAGSFARIGRDNKLYLTFQNETSETFDESQYGDDIKINSTFGPCNRVVLRMSQVEGENVTLQDDEDIAKNGVKEIVIADNPFTYTQEKREQAITAIYNQLKGYTFVDFSFTARKTKPYLDVGDTFIIIDKNGNSIKTQLYTNNLVFNGGLKAKMSAETLTNSETKYAFTPKLQSALKRTEIIVDKQNQSISQIVQQVEGQNEAIAKQEIKIDNIETAVSKTTTYRNEVSAYTQVYIDDSKGGNILKLTIRGSKVYSSNLFPGINIYPSSTLQPNSRR